MLTVFLCVCLCVCVFAICSKLKRNAHNLPPVYPGALPIIGHTHIIMQLADTSKLWLRIQDLVDNAYKNGGVNHVIIGTQIYYVIVDPEDALTASNACLQKHFAYQFAKSWLGDGLITAREDIWKRHRRLISPAFGLPVIYGFLGVFNEQARKLICRVEPHVGKGPFKPDDYVKKTALEASYRATFGINTVVDDMDVIEKYMTSVDTILDIVTHRFQTFWQHSDYLFELSGLKKREQVAIEYLKNMSNELIQKKKIAMKNDDANTNNNNVKRTGIKYKPALELLLEFSKDGTMSDKEIWQEMDTMMVAGFETISTQLVYTLVFLGANQDAQEKMFNEIVAVLGSTRDVDKDDLNQLVYTNAVIMESLRLLPTVPALLRYVEKDVKLKNYTMRAGSQCVLCPLINTHDPTWGPSGDKFLPERWLKNPELNGSKEFAGFGLGKRACVGRQYAIVAMKVFLSHFIRQYKVTADINDLKLKIEFVLKPVSGNEIAITRRQ